MDEIQEVRDGDGDGDDCPSLQLVMRVIQWLDRPAASFVYAARW
jgi:hypothetical protein